MKSIFDYGVTDWLRLRPLVHAYKTTRYRLVDRAYRHRPARLGDLQSMLPRMRRRRVLITIAYNDPQLIAWQAPLVRLFVPETLYIIADNSPDAQSSRAIEEFADHQKFPYVRLPINAWADGSRSHGLALNWVWYNLVRPGEPEVVGFLDHDLFPTAPDDPFAALSHQDFFGLVRPAGPRWFLWAGFCMFKFDRMRDKPLDFGQDWFNGLDTGGGNWRVLYRNTDRQRLREAPHEMVPFKPGIEQEDGPLQWCGTWLHEVGWLGRPELRADKRRAVAEILAPHLAKAELMDRGSLPANAP